MQKLNSVVGAPLSFAQYLASFFYSQKISEEARITLEKAADTEISVTLLVNVPLKEIPLEQLKELEIVMTSDLSTSKQPAIGARGKGKQIVEAANKFPWITAVQVIPKLISSVKRRAYLLNLDPSKPRLKTATTGSDSLMALKEKLQKEKSLSIQGEYNKAIAVEIIEPLPNYCKSYKIETIPCTISRCQTRDLKNPIYPNHHLNLERKCNQTVALLDSGICLSRSHIQISDSSNFINKGGDCQDNWGHGTHLAGIINQLSPDSKFLVGKVVDDDGDSTLEYAIEGINWATSKGAELSLMAMEIDCDSKAFMKEQIYASFLEAVEKAHKAGNIVIFSAGNQNGETLWNGPCITVGSLQINNESSKFTNTPATIFYYGEGVSSWKSKTFEMKKILNLEDSVLKDPIILGGTSQAAAMVVGILAAWSSNKLWDSNFKQGLLRDVYSQKRRWYSGVRIFTPNNLSNQSHWYWALEWLYKSFCWMSNLSNFNFGTKNKNH